MSGQLSNESGPHVAYLTMGTSHFENAAEYAVRDYPGKDVYLYGGVSGRNESYVYKYDYSQLVPFYWKPKAPKIYSVSNLGDNKFSLTINSGFSCRNGQNFDPDIDICKQDTLQKRYVYIYASTSQSGTYTLDTTLEVSSFSPTIQIPESLGGKYVQLAFGIQTAKHGEIISTKYSTSYKINSKPNAPTVVLPPSGAYHYNSANAFVRLKAGADQQGSSQSLFKIF